MAIFHFAVKSLSRGKGHSASAAAAYRAGIALEDPSTGLRHDYTRRAGVVAVDMLAPDGAPAWVHDPAQLWANVENHETRKNARVAREVVIALPHELDAQQRRNLAQDVGRLLVERYGVAVQVAIHAPDKGGDDRNHHAHLLMTPRTVGPDGFGAYAAKAYDDFKAGPEELKAMRAEVAGRFNQALERTGLAARVDHRTLLAQKAEAAQKSDFAQVVALDRPATKHEGKAVTQARRRGERLRVPSATTACAAPPPAGPMPTPTASRRSRPKPPPRAGCKPWTNRPCTPKPCWTANTPSAPAGRPLWRPHAMTTPSPSPAASADAPPLSRETALMLSESENPDLATSACLRCAHSTALTLGWPPAEDERPKPPALVLFCAQMNRDISAPVLRCSSFQPKA